MVVSVLICVGAFVWWLAERLFNRSNRWTRKRSSCAVVGTITRSSVTLRLDGGPVSSPVHLRAGLALLGKSVLHPKRAQHAAIHPGGGRGHGMDRVLGGIGPGVLGFRCGRCRRR